MINVASASEVNNSHETLAAKKVAPELDTYINESCEFSLLKKYTDTYIMYFSDDDPYIDLEKSKKYFSEKIPESVIKEFH